MENDQPVITRTIYPTCEYCGKRFQPKEPVYLTHDHSQFWHKQCVRAIMLPDLDVRVFPPGQEVKFEVLEQG